MKIYWSLLAVERLEDIYEYISNDNVLAAQNLIDNTLGKVESLKNNSERGEKFRKLTKKIFVNYLKVNI